MIGNKFCSLFFLDSVQINTNTSLSECYDRQREVLTTANHINVHLTILKQSGITGQFESRSLERVLKSKQKQLARWVKHNKKAQSWESNSGQTRR